MSLELSEDITVEIEKFLEELSEPAKIDVPRWNWTKTLMAFSNFDLDNNEILVDQIYQHIWAEKDQRITIWMIMNYEIAFCFYHYIHKIPLTGEREKTLEVPKETKARRYAATKSGLSTADYSLVAFDLYRNIGSRLMDYLIKS